MAGGREIFNLFFQERQKMSSKTKTHAERQIDMNNLWAEIQRLEKLPRSTERQQIIRAKIAELAQLEAEG